MLGKIEARRRRGKQRMRWLVGVINSMYMSLSKLWEMVKDREVWCAQFMGLLRVRDINDNNPDRRERDWDST